jgi:hypothetical protein
VVVDLAHLGRADGSAAARGREVPASILRERQRLGGSGRRRDDVAKAEVCRGDLDVREVQQGLIELTFPS